jgi:hypothetical protein
LTEDPLFSKVTITAVALVWAAQLRAVTLTVDSSGRADYTDIQSALDAAADRDVVLVKPGEYVITEPINFNRLHDPHDPASPPVKNIVVRSEGGPEVTTIRMAETPTNSDNASVLVFENGETNGSALDGFTISGGQGPWGYGGGVFCANSSSPTLTNCTISGNSSDYDGGGVYCGEGSSPTLTNCIISGNSSGYEGDYHGGGIHCGGSPTLTNCTISGNSARRSGGVHCGEGSSPTMTNCTISGNWALDVSGVCCSDSSPTLTNCIVWGNAEGPFAIAGEVPRPT